MVMIVQVCVLLRIMLNDNQHYHIQGIEVVPCQATKNPVVKEEITIPLKTEAKDPATTESWDSNVLANSLWLPEAREKGTAAGVDLSAIRKKFTLWNTKSLTRLAKTQASGLPPVFNKEYFEPFERRAKPVTVVGIRKNGLFSRLNLNMLDGKSPDEAAELQSPYNEISSFWINDNH